MTAPVYMGGVGYTVTTAEGARPGVEVTVARPTRPAPRIVVYGDSYSVDENTPWADRSQSWPRLVADRVGAETINWAQGGTGYAHDPEGKGNFLETALAHPPTGAALVVIFGSINDSRAGQPVAAVAANAARTMQAVRAAAPRAPILVVGPQWQHGSYPAIAIAHRDAVRAVAGDHGAVFLDSSPWFTNRPDLIWTDGIHPNAAGLAYLADLIAPSVAALLPR